MALGSALAIYAIIWWLVLFTVLPWGVVTQQESGTVEAGTPESAPVRPLLVRKLLATTVLASVIWAAVYYLLVYQPIALDDVFFLPRFEPTH